MKSIGLYIHVPFCHAKCAYCDFYSLTEKSKKDSYVKAVLFALQKHPFGELHADTVYFGGGTPTTLGAKNLDLLLNAAVKHFSVDSAAEITIEANPESTTYELLRDLRGSGFNRLSVGVQSAHEQELAALGRIHTAQAAADCITAAYNTGFGHISGDLMLNIPYQTPQSLHASLDFLTDLPLDHLSAYMLILEENTPLYTSSILEYCPDEQRQAELYLQTVQILGDRGFAQYEISNFAKPGGESRHNLKYWHGEEYLGIGPSAHSFLEGKRFSLSYNIDEFIQKTWGNLHLEGPGGDWEEAAMLALRLVPGLDLITFQRRYPQAPVEAICCKAKGLASQGLVKIENSTVTLTPQGFLLSNYLTAELLFD